MCLQMVTQAGDLQISPQIATIESRSMDVRVVVVVEKGGAGKERERTGPCRWEIWLLSTSAFLNTRSYLPSPPEERSFPFSPPFSPLRRPALSLSSSHPTPKPPPLLPLRLFLPFHLSATLLYLLYTPLPFISVFFSIPASFFSSSNPNSTLLPLALRLPPLPISQALNGTAHSATKQSCLEHHTLANQAGPEFSSPQIHSTTL